VRPCLKKKNKNKNKKAQAGHPWLSPIILAKIRRISLKPAGANSSKKNHKKELVEWLKV
jgi:hypothetical protein